MYKKDDYERKKKEYGIRDDQISESDARIAAQNPDAGISLLNYKRDFLNAPTDSARAFSHAAAEAIRKQYGGYTGGMDGSGFGVLPQKEDYQPQYQTEIANAMQAMQQPFSWDPATDPRAQAYEKLFTQKGHDAMQDTLGEVSARTGGNPSSYAVTAATQANDAYMREIPAMYQKLYDQAYEQYKEKYRQNQNNIGIWQGLDDVGYGRHMAEQQADAAERQQMYDNYMRGQAADEDRRRFDMEMAYRLQNLDRSEQQAARELAYQYASLAQRGQQADNDLQYRYDALSEQGKQAVDELAYKMAALQYDADQAENALNADIYRDNRNFDYQLAKDAAEMGDYSGMQSFGVDTRNQEDMYNAWLQSQLEDPEPETEEDKKKDKKAGKGATKN